MPLSLLRWRLPLTLGPAWCDRDEHRSISCPSDSTRRGPPDDCPGAEPRLGSRSMDDHASGVSRRRSRIAPKARERGRAVACPHRDERTCCSVPYSLVNCALFRGEESLSCAASGWFPVLTGSNTTSNACALERLFLYCCLALRATQTPYRKAFPFGSA